MRDRFTRGFIAGIVSGIVPFVINWGAFALNLSTLRWSEFMGLFIFGNKPVGTGELVFTVVAQFVLLGILGIIFAYLIPLLSSENFWLKGLIYGIIIWFLAFSFTFVFQLPVIKHIPLKTAITNFIAGALWGLSLSIVLNWIDERLKT